MYHSFSVGETIKTSWHLVRKNFAMIAIYSLIGFIIILASSTFIYLFVSHDVFYFSISAVIFLLTLSFIILGFIKLIFQLLDKEYYDFDFSDIVPSFKMIFSYLLLFTVVFTLSFALNRAIEHLEEGYAKYISGIVTGGFIQFFLIFYFPICACFIVDDASGPFESVIQSFFLIRGNFLKYFFLFIIIETMAFVGLATVVGMLFAVPFGYIILAVAYRKLIYSHLDVDDNITETN
ncbi:MAG: hypothetical protein ABI203_06590 [Mucilaginibacter sp.]